MPRTARKRVVVADYAGQPAADAADAVRAADLLPAPERVDVADPALHGVVVEHEPPAGSDTTRGATVTLYIGAGATDDASAPAVEHLPDIETADPPLFTGDYLDPAPAPGLPATGGAEDELGLDHAAFDDHAAADEYASPPDNSWPAFDDELASPPAPPPAEHEPAAPAERRSRRKRIAAALVVAACIVIRALPLPHSPSSQPPGAAVVKPTPPPAAAPRHRERRPRRRREQARPRTRRRLPRPRIARHPTIVPTPVPSPQLVAPAPAPQQVVPQAHPALPPDAYDEFF